MSAREIVQRLEVDPELGGRAQRLREKPGRLRGDPPLPAGDLVHPLERDTNVPGKGDLAQAERPQEFFDQDDPGVRGNAFLGKHASSYPW
jgi:hypothetical protein